MIKEIVKNTVKTLIDRPKLIRLALLTSYSYTLYQIYGIVYFFNWIVNIQYDAWVDIWDATAYLVNSIQKFNIFRLIFVIIALFILWLAIFGPIWRQALLYSIDDKNLRFGHSFIKWWKKWWVMAEFWWVNMWWLSRWSVFIFSVRFWMLWYINNIIVKMVFIIWVLCVLCKTVFWPYVNYYIVLKDNSARDAVIKSMSLAASNLGLTIRWLLRQAIIRFKFFLNAGILIWVPIILMIWAVHLGIMNNSFIEITSRILVWIALIVFIYFESIFKAFDYTYRYNIFLEAENRSNSK